VAWLCDAPGVLQPNLPRHSTIDRLSAVEFEQGGIINRASTKPAATQLDPLRLCEIEPYKNLQEQSSTGQSDHVSGLEANRGKDDCNDGFLGILTRRYHHVCAGSG